MRKLSARSRLAVGTLVIGIFVAVAAYAASGTQGTFSVPPEELVGADAPVGDIVKVSGELASFTPTECVIISQEGGVTVRVSFREPQRHEGTGPGVLAVARGRLTAPGVLEDADLVVRGPSKFSAR